MLVSASSSQGLVAPAGFGASGWTWQMPFFHLSDPIALSYSSHSRGLSCSYLNGGCHRMRLVLHGHTQYFEILTSLAWQGIQHTPAIPLHGRQRWEGIGKFDASLVYIVNSILARDIQIIRSWVWLWLCLLMLALALLCLFVWYQIIILRRNSRDYKGLLSSFKDFCPLVLYLPSHVSLPTTP